MATSTRKNTTGPKPLDRIDRLILDALQLNGRLSNVALARRVNLTPTPCLERVKRLERDGYITGYGAHLNPGMVGASLLVFVEISLLRNSPDAFREFRQHAVRLTNILECHLVSGNFDYLIKARVKDMNEYRELLSDKILALPGVNNSRSYVVIEEVKETSLLPIIRKS